jgi:phospholipid/cholesterol/gamma-HCH transport system substrate-binding protein
VPNQHEVRWSQLKVGVLVLVALAALTLLISLMSGSSGGIFSRHIIVHSFFGNASGLKPGAPVNLQGVTIGTVKKIIIVPGRKLTPVEVIMSLGLNYKAALHTDTSASLATAGVLGDTFVDLDSAHATGPQLTNGAEVPVVQTPSLSDVIKSSQTTIQQVNVILAKLNTMADALGTSKGSLGLFINNPDLYKHAVATLTELQGTITKINQGKGTLGKLVADDELYKRANDTVSRLQDIVNQVDAGKGTVGKLVKDDALYNNVNQTAANANHLIADINQGKGTLGMMAKDEAFRKKVSLTISDLQSILHRADAGEGTVGKLLHDPSLYNNSDQAIVEMRKLLAAIRANPKKYLVIRLHVF